MFKFIFKLTFTFRSAFLLEVIIWVLLMLGKPRKLKFGMLFTQTKQDSLREMSKPIFWEKYHILKWYLKFLSNMLNVKISSAAIQVQQVKG